MQLAYCSVVDELVRCASAEFCLDRRKNRRYPFFRPITVNIDGTTFNAFSRNVSSTSIGLLHNFPIEAKIARLSIPTTTGRIVDVVTDVRRCEMIDNGWWLSGAQFRGTSVWRVPSLLLAVIAAETHRRFEQRFPFLTAAKIATLGTNAKVLSGFTTDISTDGIGLVHDRPLGLQRVTVTLHRRAVEPTEVKIDIKWCQPCHEGWYISGGRFASHAFAELPELIC